MRYSFFTILFILFVSCKKQEQQPHFVNTGNPNNKMEADITIGNSNYHLSAWGDYTLFNKMGYPNGDTSISILASTDTSEVEISLTNISAPGTYQFGEHPVPGQDLRLMYESGMINGGAGTYYFNNTITLTGQIIIESLTNNSIKGSFRDTCWNNGKTSIINNGSFSGEF